LRLAAVTQLREAGLRVGISASPMIPGITEGELESLAEASKKAGALWFFSNVLFLMPSSAKEFLPFIRERFPRLAKQYEEWYAKNGYAPEEYRKKMSERVRTIRERFGFAPRPAGGTRATWQPAQMSLGWDAAAIRGEIQRMRSCAAG
jgi:DNA repair photolyase